MAHAVDALAHRESDPRRAAARNRQQLRAVARPRRARPRRGRRRDRARPRRAHRPRPRERHVLRELRDDRALVGDRRRDADEREELVRTARVRARGRAAAAHARGVSRAHPLERRPAGRAHAGHHRRERALLRLERRSRRTRRSSTAAYRCSPPTIPRASVRCARTSRSACTIRPSSATRTWSTPRSSRSARAPSRRSASTARCSRRRRRASASRAGAARVRARARRCARLTRSKRGCGSPPSCCALAALALGALVAHRPPTRIDVEAVALRGKAVPLALFFTAPGPLAGAARLGVLAFGVAMALRTGLSAVVILYGVAGHLASGERAA